MSLRRPEAPGRKLPCDRQNAIWDLTINNQSINALQNQFSRILFQQDGADREIIEHDHTAPNQGALKFLGAAGREDIVIDYQTGAITIGASGTLTLNLPIVTNPDDFQVGTTYAGDPQLWYKEADGRARFGSSTQVGDAADRASNGILVYGPNNAGTQDATNVGYAEVNNDQFRLLDVDTGVTTIYFRVRPANIQYQRIGSTGYEFQLLAAGTVVGTGNGAEVQTVVLNNYANLNFANDAAAAAGGVPLGGVYHNSGAMLVRIV